MQADPASSAGVPISGYPVSGSWWYRVFLSRIAIGYLKHWCMQPL